MCSFRLIHDVVSQSLVVKKKIFPSFRLFLLHLARLKGTFEGNEYAFHAGDGRKNDDVNCVYKGAKLKEIRSLLLV